MYFDLVRRYGDVPLIKEVQNFDNLEELWFRMPQSDIYDLLILNLSRLEKFYLMQKSCSYRAWACSRSRVGIERPAMLLPKDMNVLLFLKVMDQQYFILDPDYNALFQSYGGNREVIFEVMFDGVE